MLSEKSAVGVYFLYEQYFDISSKSIEDSIVSMVWSHFCKKYAGIEFYLYTKIKGSENMYGLWSLFHFFFFGLYEFFVAIVLVISMHYFCNE